MHLKNHRYVIILKFATVVGLVIIESVLQVDGISENARNQRCGTTWGVDSVPFWFGCNFLSQVTADLIHTE
jgi:hypothetical protein